MKKAIILTAFAILVTAIMACTPTPTLSPTAEPQTRRTPAPAINDYPAPAKPVIYLYPETPTEISVKLQYNGTLDCTYPAYDNGWNVTAHPDGTLFDLRDNKEYSYLDHRLERADQSRGMAVGVDGIRKCSFETARHGRARRSPLICAAGG